MGNASVRRQFLWDLAKDEVIGHRDAGVQRDRKAFNHFAE